MVLKLYYNKACACSRSLVLISKAVELSIQLIDCEKWDSAFIAKDTEIGVEIIPRLNNEQEMITDYLKIVEFIITNSQDCDIIPKDEVQKQKTNDLINYSISTLFPILSEILVPIILDKEIEIPAKKLTLIHESYSFVDNILISDYLIGSHWSLVDLCIVASISSFTLIVPIACGKYPKLFQWYNNLKKLPFYKDANENGLNELDKILEEKLRRL